MSFWVYFLLLAFGSAFGSFLNVVSLRFNPDEGGLLKDIYGRSHCPHCGRTLRWYELIPLVSFFIQLGKCRSCSAELTLQYPIVELLSGAIFVLVPYNLLPAHPLLPAPYFFIFTWILVLLALLLMSIIDFHHRIIPDSINVFIAVIGLIFIVYKYFSGFQVKEISGGSFLGSYSLLFPFGGQFPLHHLIGLVFGFLFLGTLFVISGGRGMGFGDVKLAAALGLFMGWPDVGLALLLAFITGAILSLVLIFLRRKTIKDYVPFGPFIALGATLVFFFGHQILYLYFQFFDTLLPF